MPPAAKDNGLLEGMKVGFGRGQIVEEPGDLEVKECFRLVASRRKGVERVGKTVVKDGQRLDTPGRQAT